MFTKTRFLRNATMLTTTCALTNIAICTIGMSLYCVSAIEIPQPHPDLVHDIASQPTPNLHRFMPTIVPTMGFVESRNASCPICPSVGEDNQDNGIFAKIFNRVQDIFGENNIFSKLINVLFKAFQVQRNDFLINLLDDVKIPVDIVLPTLFNASSQFVSIADTIRRDETSSDANTTEFEKSLLSSVADFSASNMESVSTLIDLMIAEWSSRDTISVTSLSCGLVLINSFISNNVLPNIASIAD
jgi:hypothetical protein